MTFPIRYATIDGLKIAYQIAGDGPIDLVMVDEWATPLEERWNVPAIGGRLRRLLSFARVISFDKRGIGLSDAGAPADLAVPELWVRDLAAVIDDAEAQKPVIFGAHEGGPISLMYAASHPQRTEALILANTGPRLVRDVDYPFGPEPEFWNPDIAGIVELWQSGGGGVDHISATEHDPWWRDWYARSRRQQATPAAGLALMRMIGRVDVRHIVPSIGAPALVVHRRDNQWWSIGGARWLAEQLPAATLVELEGRDNYWWSGDADRIVDEIEQFLLGERTSAGSHRELVTMMFTDVVSSTERADRLGDAEWRSLLENHDDATVAAVERHGGAVVKNLGDGFLLTFPGPAAAITAARQIHDAVDRAGLDLRISIHTGEVERRGQDLNGIAVHLASRMLDAADEGQTVVSSVIPGLVAGSGISFESAGRHAFKGIVEQWDVFRVLAETG